MSPIDESMIETLVGRLAAERTGAELELLGGILADPVRGMREVERHGIHLGMFSDNDTRAIFLATEYAAVNGKLAVLDMARKLLKGLGLWDEQDQRSHSRSMIWGLPALESLADSYPGPAIVGNLATRLRHLTARLEQAAAHFRRAVGLLDGSINPCGVSPFGQGNVVEFSNSIQNESRGISRELNFN